MNPASPSLPALNPPGEESLQLALNFAITGILPSRVRENPGGNSSLANFWDSEEATDFKPTRR